MVWLVRNDYRATIAINEMHLDAEANRAVGEEGLIALAGLSLALSAKENSATVTKPPEVLSINNADCCAYELAAASGDRIRVVLVKTGVNVYEAVAFIEGEGNGGTPAGVFSAQQGVLETLQWK